jgi:hypothetical protein
MDHLTTPFDPATPMRDLLRLAIPICRAAEAALPPRGPGRPVEIPESALAAMILLALAKRLRSKSAQYRFLAARGPALAARLGLDRFPARSTYFARYRTAYLLMAVAVADHAERRSRRGHIDPTCVAADKTPIAASGPAWHNWQRARGERPPGVDAEASWSRSKHDGWVYGYGAEVVVSAPRAGVVWPRAASADPAHVREAVTFPAKVPGLPGRTRYVTVDMGYDSNDLAEAVELDAAGRRTGRRLVGPQQVRPHARRPAKQRWRETRRRRARREHREERRRFYGSRFGRALYKRRGKTVEPFFGHVKALFGREGHVWHPGLGNVRAQVVGAVLLDQILLAYNRIRGAGDAEVTWILDLL